MYFATLKNFSYFGKEKGQKVRENRYENIIYERIFENFTWKVGTGDS